MIFFSEFYVERSIVSGLCVTHGDINDSANNSARIEGKKLIIKLF